jgi:TRAP-type mannitol/chloroaromatic compound transport system permease large subunit
MLLGFLALIAPCGGSFGLPKLISLFTGVASAVVIVAAVTAPPTAVAANMSRLEIIAYSPCVRFSYSAGTASAWLVTAGFGFSPNNQLCSRSR